MSLTVGGPILPYWIYGFWGLVAFATGSLLGGYAIVNRKTYPEAAYLAAMMALIKIGAAGFFLVSFFHWDAVRDAGNTMFHTWPWRVIPGAFVAMSVGGMVGLMKWITNRRGLVLTIAVIVVAMFLTGLFYTTNWPWAG